MAYAGAGPLPAQERLPVVVEALKARRDLDRRDFRLTQPGASRMPAAEHPRPAQWENACPRRALPPTHPAPPAASQEVAHQLHPRRHSPRRRQRCEPALARNPAHLHQRRGAAPRQNSAPGRKPPRRPSRPRSGSESAAPLWSTARPARFCLAEARNPSDGSTPATKAGAQRSRIAAHSAPVPRRRRASAGLRAPPARKGSAARSAGSSDRRTVRTGLRAPSVRDSTAHRATVAAHHPGA